MGAASRPMSRLVFLFFILPRYGGMLGRYVGIALTVGCASILSAYVAVLPEHFRSRSGSIFAKSRAASGRLARSAGRIGFRGAALPGVAIVSTTRYNAVLAYGNWPTGARPAN